MPTTRSVHARQLTLSASSSLSCLRVAAPGVVGVSWANKSDIMGISYLRPIELPIDICRRGQVVTRAVVERWSMPDGQRGVKWGGLAFPFFYDGRIETTDQATPPAMCRPLIEPRPSWRLERGGPDADAYVFLDGDGATLERALHDLSVAGLNGERAGPIRWFSGRSVHPVGFARSRC